MNRTMAHIANIFLLSALIIGSAMVWDNLPARIPVHMNASGMADRWQDRTFWSWFALPMVAVGTMALLYSCARMIVRRPELINIPNKKEFLELPPDRQAPIIRLVRSLLYWIGASVTATMLLVQYGLYRAAFGDYSEAYGIVATLGCIIVGPILSVIVIVKVQSLMDAEKRRRAAAGS